MLKTISLIAFFMAFYAIIGPYGFEAVILFAGLASALTLQQRPVISSVTFMINLFNVAAHVPGLVFPASKFASGILAIGGPLHWGFLAIQIPILLSGFLLMVSMNTPRVVVHNNVHDTTVDVHHRDRLF